MMDLAAITFRSLPGDEVAQRQAAKGASELNHLIPSHLEKGRKTGQKRHQRVTLL